METDLTPIRKQYLEIKKQHPDALLFFRLGDFYETFDEDAEIASRELDIVLTGRSVAKGRRIPMAGIPYHAAENYIARLIQRGYHVAVCEQVGEAVKGLMPREVTRVITPGTVTDPGMLAPKRNNYLASAAVLPDQAAVAYADITTGEFRTVVFHATDPAAGARAELVRLNPAEVLLVEGTDWYNGGPGALSRWPAWRFEPGRCEDALRRHFDAAALDGFGLERRSPGIRAAGVLLQYLSETQPAALASLERLSTYTLDDFMALDPATRRGLELTETIRSGETDGSLLGVLDHTVTPMGGRLLRQWVLQPLLSLGAIRERQDGVQAFLDSGLRRTAFRESLESVHDLERIIHRVGAGLAGPRDLIALRSTLTVLPDTVKRVGEIDPKLWPEPDPCADCLDLLTLALAEEPPAVLSQIGVIRPGYSPDLDGIVEGAREAREWIAGLEASEKKRTGIKTLKVGYNKVFGYYIEISRGHASAAPPEYIRKQTLVNAERFITPEMKEYEARVLHAEERIRELETRLFREVCLQLTAQRGRLLAVSHRLAGLDCLSAVAEAAARYEFARPEVTDDTVLDIRQGRHPVVERFLTEGRFVPNDTVFESGEMIRVITGPNMSGKSTYLRQVALICLMAQIGSFVPARSARIGLVDRIFARVGAQDEIHAGRSTFMVEMVETANILHHATARSLLIFDEVGRGTSTYDGVSIAWAVIEYLHNHPRLHTRTLFATHYHELIGLSGLLAGVRNYNVSVAEEGGRVVFLHTIIPGGADKSYGIHVAQLAGLPRPVIARAEEILRQLESGKPEAADERGEAARQLALFPESDPIRIELEKLDLASITPLEAISKLYEWQKLLKGKNDGD
jgi:DNA mismatch repair protein MutS